MPLSPSSPTVRLKSHRYNVLISLLLFLHSNDSPNVRALLEGYSPQPESEVL